MKKEDYVLEVKDLSITFTQYKKWFQRVELPALKRMCVTVKRGEITAVIGSSGSGKSLLAHAVLGILPYNAKAEGEILFQGEPLTEERKKAVRGREIVLVPQSVSYLDPLMQVGVQVRNGDRSKEARERDLLVLKRYGLDEETEKLYPFELSGGMARRILISSAVMEKPSLVIADEPTPGLHLGAAKRVLGHFREIADDGAGVLLITHDLELALAVADRVVVLYSGMTVEEADVDDFHEEGSLRHPYTKALYRAMPQNGFMAEKGAQPYLMDRPSGCPYRPRCSCASEACAQEIPWVKSGNGYVRCINFVHQNLDGEEDES